MISAVIHLANKDYPSLVDDFIQLNILPSDSDRFKIIPLMDKALSPYVKGGGAKMYEQELKKIYGMEDDSVASAARGFQAMTQDALTVLNDVPFSIPAYFAILGRAVVTLEGIALSGNENYGIIMESYPFIARKLLREDRPEIQRALMEVLYSGESNNNNGGSSALKFSRLIALLNSAAGERQLQSDGSSSAFVDLDAIPENGISFGDGLKVLLSKRAESLRTLLEPEIDNIVDIFFRQIIRRGVGEAIVALTPRRPTMLPFLSSAFPPAPKIDEIPLVMPLPPRNGNASPPSLGLLSIKDLVDYLAPKLSRDEEIYAINLADAAQEFFGDSMGKLVRGDSVVSVESAKLLLTAAQKGALGRQDLLSTRGAQQLLVNIGSLLDIVGRQRGMKISSSSQSTFMSDALDELNQGEKDELNKIVTETLQRSMKKAVRRLSAAPRIF
jgi:aarF domain-containing kinase